MSKSIKVRLSKPYFPRAALTASNLEFWVGRESQTHRVVRGLLASTDTHYLITGYPGVGKTSFVSRVIAEWRRLSALQGINRVLIFNLQFVQPQSATEVVQRIMGKVYFGSLDGQFSPGKQLAERLQLSFIQAYSKSLKEVQAETTAKNGGAEAKLKFAPLSESEIGVSLKRAKESSRSLEIQKEYNLNAAISDLESVLHLLTRPESHARRKLWPFWKSSEVSQPRVLFVFDQIDDLNNVQELSNLFSIPNASFIVIGGIKLKEQVASEQEKGSHALDNFQEEYLPCQWNAADKILSLLISETDMGSHQFVEYRDYLNFYAQGLPRRIFAAIDQHTHLEDDEFYLQLTDSDFVRVRLCARLHRLLWKNRKRILGEHIDSVQYHLRDKALRGMYHLADQIFRVAQFDFQDVSTAVTQISDTIFHTKREKVLKNMLEVFVTEGLVTNVRNTYSLSDDVVRLVKRIPNWLKDGFVDAHDLLRFDTYTGVIQESVVDLRGALVPLVQEIERPVSEPPPTPTSLGKYRIVRRIGMGGMGEVYLAVDEVLNRPVALKVIAPTFSASENFQKRFMQEARVVARLVHPNIVQIYNLEQIEGRLVFVSEYVEGQNLEQLMKQQGSLSPSEAMRIGIAIAQALEVAHQHAIIHRDVKPSNVLISESGNIKLTDFGIAKLAQDLESTQLTQAGILVGTPAYMSPEQIEGQIVDTRTDLYALGAVLYEMLTGKRYFDAASPMTLLYKIINEQPLPPSRFNKSIPQALDALIMRCLAKNPKDRFSSAGDLAQELQRILRSLDKRENKQNSQD